MNSYGFFTVTGCVILTSSVEEGGLVCPGEEVTFTCTVIEQPSLGWNNEQYIVGEVIFLCRDQMKLRVPISRGPFQIVLTSLSPSNSSQVANITSTLTVNATLTLNGTVVECNDWDKSAEITLHVAIGKGNWSLATLFTHIVMNSRHIERCVCVCVCVCVRVCVRVCVCVCVWRGGGGGGY